MASHRLLATPASPATPPGDAVPDAARLTLLTLLDADPAVATRLDGAWSPRSADLAAELPALVAELDRRGIRVTRVAYNPRSWDPAPRELDLDGRTVHLGWFDTIDPWALSLTGVDAGDRTDLLVVPPGTAVATATRAVAGATGHANRLAPSAVLAAAAR